MYRCEDCGVIAPPRVRAATVVVETRPKVYPLRPKANVGFKADRVVTMRKTATGGRLYFKVRRRSRARNDRLADQGGVGTEIARVLRCCPACAAARARPIAFPRE